MHVKRRDTMLVGYVSLRVNTHKHESMSPCDSSPKRNESSWGPPHWNVSLVLLILFMLSVSEPILYCNGTRENIQEKLRDGKI